MNFKLSSENHIFHFSSENSPALMVGSGDEVEIDTLDCFSNQLKTEEDSLESLDWNRINPATGPIFVSDAEMGDTLKVTILDITLKDSGVMVAGKDFGTLGNILSTTKTKILKMHENETKFDDNISIKLNPMIGVIGVSPASGKINCGTPGAHGGNMDNKMITKGAIIYFPVFTKGALFALGDLHAAMGDGEIGVTGIEIPGTVKVKLEVIKNTKFDNPILENDKFFSTIASSESLDDAVEKAALDMFYLLSSRLDLTPEEIVMLMSAAGETQICQIVDPLKTARFIIGKDIIKNKALI